MEPALTPTPEATRVSFRRYLAHLLDTALYGLAFVLLLVAVSAVPSQGRIGDYVLWVVLVVGLTVGQVAFYVVLHGRTGRTPGKRLAGIRVVDAEGRPPSRGALVRRSIPLALELVTIFAAIAMLVSPYRQRLGDRWGHTFVVRG